MCNSSVKTSKNIRQASLFVYFFLENEFFFRRALYKWSERYIYFFFILMYLEFMYMFKLGYCIEKEKKHALLHIIWCIGVCPYLNFLFRCGVDNLYYFCLRESLSKSIHHVHVYLTRKHTRCSLTRDIILVE